MIMKIKKLYAEPEMKLHKLKTSTILQASQGQEAREDVDWEPGLSGDEGD